MTRVSFLCRVQYLSSRLVALARVTVATLPVALARHSTAALVVPRYAAVVADYAVEVRCWIHHHSHVTPRDKPTLPLVSRQVIQVQMVHGSLDLLQVEAGTLVL